MEEKKITILEAYKAMLKYLENLYELTESDDLAGFLGSMTLLEDGKPADQAVWHDWINAVNNTLDKSKEH
ncbi:hypothetical protein ADIS_0431 [Lunatimonas lonarensis]|uniref:Uncharacterized protein n=1 Tax=Lunatimonas lonarensis TaxID=1232681 RepID=R7ZY99_9BACT|nr:hypothetical protein [Lunatimonas lonarensis]EON79014.1 hypothetical protein ADIS_0431 [Lunatimonas lonarensis]